jgi:hypothetical protein
VLDRLTDEHRVIHEVLDSVDRALIDFITTPDDLTELQEVADLLSDALLSHLAYEERKLIDPSPAKASTFRPGLRPEGTAPFRGSPALRSGKADRAHQSGKVHPPVPPFGPTRGTRHLRRPPL